jgi:hypothetical protein
MTPDEHVGRLDANLERQNAHVETLDASAQRRCTNSLPLCTSFETPDASFERL